MWKVNLLHSSIKISSKGVPADKQKHFSWLLYLPFINRRNCICSFQERKDAELALQLGATRAGGAEIIKLVSYFLHCIVILLVFNSPDMNGHVNYSHHFALSFL